MDSWLSVKADEVNGERKPHLVDRSPTPHLSKAKRVSAAIRNKDEPEEMGSTSNGERLLATQMRLQIQKRNKVKKHRKRAEKPM